MYYRVIYEIDIDSEEGPEQAAREACELMRSPESMLPVLTVLPWPQDGQCPALAATFYKGAVNFDLDRSSEPCL